MLEKIGLPARPALRGNSWVMDASHCQGCSSQFTLFNRKHHCRRCGGLFCNSCTSQRMYLRGQGDSSVRVCDPCKKLEDAARLQARSKIRTKGIPKSKEMPDDELLENVADIASVSKLLKLDDDREATAEMDNITPEDLRLQSQEEKKKYYTLKKEKKHDEALQAFKRHKEFERRAEALELNLRKNRRKAMKMSLRIDEKSQEILDDAESTISGSSETAEKMEPAAFMRKPASKHVNTEKDDFSSALKELGWSDADLHNTDGKRSKMSVENELSSLLGVAENRSSNGPNQAQVLSHKKKALALKREGRLAEAKEELKKAKILEKQIEEQMIFGQDEESDDELASLMGGLDNESKVDAFKDLDMGLNNEAAFDIAALMKMDEGGAVDMGLDVTDDDMLDPDLTEALRSIGWEEDDSHEDMQVSQNDRVHTQEKVLQLKKEALALKRAGNISDAKTRLHEAKLLEKDLQDIPSQHFRNTLNAENPEKSISAMNFSHLKFGDNENDAAEVPDDVMGDPEVVHALKNLGWTDGVGNTDSHDARLVNASGSSSKTKSEIQKELLGIKRRALALRREGRSEEADAELSKAKVLEKDLEGTEISMKAKETKSGNGRRLPSVISGNALNSEGEHLNSLNEKEDEPVEVTEADMNDPDLANALKELGLQDEDDPKVPASTGDSQSVLSMHTETFKSKAQIKKELLCIKRKALTLRREGKHSQADAELQKGKELEEQFEEMETSQGLRSRNLVETLKFFPQKLNLADESDVLNKSDRKDSDIEQFGQENVMTMPPKNTNKAQIQKELLAIKRKALALRRAGRMPEADEELAKGNQLEQQLETLEKSEVIRASANVFTEDSKQNNNSQEPVMLSTSTDAIPSGMPKLESKNHAIVGTALDVDKKDIDKDFIATLLHPPQKGASHGRKELASEGEKSMINMKQGQDLHSVTKVEMLNPVDTEGYTGIMSSLTSSSSASNTRSEEAAHLHVPREHIPSNFDLLSGDTWQPASDDPPVKLMGTDDDVSIPDIFPNYIDNYVGKDGGKADLPVWKHSAITEQSEKHNECFQKNEETSLTGVKDAQHRMYSSGTPHPDELSQASSNSLQQNLHQQILSYKRKALSLKREGRLAEAKEQLRLAKLLEKEGSQSNNLKGYSSSSSVSTNMASACEYNEDAERRLNQSQDDKPTIQPSHPNVKSRVASSSERMLVSMEANEKNDTVKRSQFPKQLPGRDRIKLQREALAHKKRALALKREGKVEESEAELEKAKSLEHQLEECSTNTSEPDQPIDFINKDGGMVDGLLDAQLLSALKGIGWEERDIFGEMSAQMAQPKSKGLASVSKDDHGTSDSHPMRAVSEISNNEREKSALQESIKSEKMQALEFKRAGKQAEALDALRRAKKLERKLQSLNV